MALKKKGSKGFERCQAHRENYINWSINQLNLQNTRQVNLERMLNVNRGRRVGKVLARWTYRDIFGKLESFCEERGVLILRKDPAYTSQRCSKCGWTRKSNRKGSVFKCGQCGNTLDADLNASLNLALELPEISRKQRLKKINRRGFYWLSKGQESIVPAVQETLK
jgi:transposase